MYDVIFKNGNVVDVKNEQILQADIAVKDGKIAGIGHFSGENVIDCTGKYITPGFIDAHVHIESSMATPMEFSKAVMTHGTTTVIADPHELVNVKGNEAMEYILDAAGDAPLGIYVMMPSSIPATPFETNGADFTAEDMKQWKDHPLVLGLGEVMCYPAVLSKEEQIMKKLELCKGMVIDGHAPGLSGEDLKAYVEAGVMTDHECTSFEEAKEKCLAGMKILVREGSAARNVENIVPGLVKEPEFIAHFMFCTDDKHIEDIEKEGHIDHNVRKAIGLGMNPIDAICMATINSAKCYGLTHLGAIAPGYQADLLVVDNLEKMTIQDVYYKGRKIDQDGEIIVKECPSELKNTVHVGKFSKEDLRLESPDGIFNVVGMQEGEITTVRKNVQILHEMGVFTADEQYQKIAVVERHKATGKTGVGVVSGFGIQGGAIASSVSHDSHNIIVIGDNDEDMYLAVQELIRTQGGYTLVADHHVYDTLELPIMGLMSDAGFQYSHRKLERMIRKAHEMGVPDAMAPFITLSFMALPVIPEIRVTPRGIYNVCSGEFYQN